MTIRRPTQDDLRRLAEANNFDITDAEMDARGNGTHEIRNWIAIAGAVNGAKGEVLMYENAMGCGSGMMRYHLA